MSALTRDRKGSFNVAGRSAQQVTASLGPAMETPGEQLLNEEKKKRICENQETAGRKTRNHGEVEDNTEKGTKPSGALAAGEDMHT